MDKKQKDMLRCLGPGENPSESSFKATPQCSIFDIKTTSTVLRERPILRSELARVLIDSMLNLCHPTKNEGSPKRSVLPSTSPSTTRPPSSTLV